MLYWGVFTGGYIIGTLFTLSLFFKKTETGSFDNASPEKKNFEEKDSWEKYQELVKVNFTKGEKDLKTKDRYQLAN